MDNFKYIRKFTCRFLVVSLAAIILLGNITCVNAAEQLKMKNGDVAEFSKLPSIITSAQAIHSYGNIFKFFNFFEFTDTTDGLLGLMDKNGNILLEPSCQEIFESNGKIGCFNDGMGNVISSRTGNLLSEVKAAGTGYTSNIPYIDSDGLKYNRLSWISDGSNAYTKSTLPYGLTLYQQTLDKYGQYISDPRDIKYGYVDKSGSIVIQPKYYEAMLFSENLAVVTSCNKYGPFMCDIPISGYIDTKGKYAIPLKYDAAESFLYGYAVVQYNKYNNIIDAKGKNLFDDSDLLALSRLDEKSFIVNLKGHGWGILYFPNAVKVASTYTSSSGYNPQSTQTQGNNSQKEAQKASGRSGTKTGNNCKYPAYLQKGDTAEIKNKTSVSIMTEDLKLPLTAAYPGKKFTIISQAYCKGNTNYYYVNFNGWEGLLPETIGDTYVIYRVK